MRAQARERRRVGICGWTREEGEERERGRRETEDETSDRDVALHRQLVLDTFS